MTTHLINYWCMPQVYQNKKKKLHNLCVQLVIKNVVIVRVVWNRM